jgi:hypothetical protein
LKNKDRRPNLYIIAGPNGAGKTTFARKFLPEYVKCLEFVNVDLIANGISPFDPERAALRAGRIMLEQIHSFAERGMVEILDPGLFNILLKYKGNQWKRVKERLSFWHTKPKKHFGRLWLRRSPNIGEMEFRLPSGAMAKRYVSPLIRSKFGNLKLNTPSLVRSAGREASPFLRRKYHP